MLGSLGNLLSLLAVPWAARRRYLPLGLQVLMIKCRYFHLDKQWNLVTVFILNLAVADFLYCSINLSVYSIQVGKTTFAFLCFSYVLSVFLSLKYIAWHRVVFRLKKIKMCLVKLCLCCYLVTRLVLYIHMAIL